MVCSKPLCPLSGAEGAKKKGKQGALYRRQEENCSAERGKISGKLFGERDDRS
ncbi:hypothetical protein Q649_00043 [Bartonella quintana JK 73]|uniref:Uncharacterized protein n=1 Tax=Bartonella quintana JK 73 TaxID=1402976 RepID=W3U159_BARQI|nr:hypothetical protein Q650_00043 [Bartonella quintana JK 73rel]ETS17405.1 hypothetical protein Q649_00043 [Bartonella quintana JK 73]